MDIINNFFAHCDLSTTSQQGLDFELLLLIFIIVPFWIYVIFSLCVAIEHNNPKAFIVVLSIAICLTGLFNISYSQTHTNSVKQAKIVQKKYDDAASKLIQKYPNVVILHTQDGSFFKDAQTTLLFTQHPLSNEELNDYSRGKNIDLNNNDDQVICQFDPDNLTDKESTKFPTHYHLNDYQKLKNTKTDLWVKGITKNLKNDQ